MYKKKVVRGIPGFISFILILPMVVYIILRSTIEGYSNNIFKILSIVLFFLGLVVMLSIVSLNFLIYKKRKTIYSTVVKKEKKYAQGREMLEKLLRMPQNRFNLVSTSLHIAYVEMRALNLDGAIKSFYRSKELNDYYNVGLSFSLLPTYYLILIYYYLDKDEEMKSEIQYFKKDSMNLKTNNYVEYVNNIDSLENKNFYNLNKYLKEQVENPFIKLVNDKIEDEM